MKKNKLFRIVSLVGLVVVFMCGRAYSDGTSFRISRVGRLSERALPQVRRSVVQKTCTSGSPLLVPLDGLDGASPSLVIANEANQMSVVLQDITLDSGHLLVTPMLMKELAMAGLGESSSYRCMLVGTDGSGRSSIASEIQFQVDLGNVSLPVFASRHPAHPEAAVPLAVSPEERKLSKVVQLSPRLTMRDDSEASRQKQAALAAKHEYLQYFYELEDGTTVVYADVPKSSSLVSLSTQQEIFGGLTCRLETNGSAQFQRVVRTALQQFGEILQSPVPLHVIIIMDTDGYYLGNDDSTIGGSFSRNGIKDGIGYMSPLLNALLGYDQSPSEDEIFIVFNPRFDFYYGLDGQVTTSDQVDLLTVMLHELTHSFGLFDGSKQGYQTYGEYSLGVPMIFDTMVVYKDRNYTSLTLAERREAITSGAIYLSGPALNASNEGKPVKLYSPSYYSPGSSVAHWDLSVTFDTFMKYVYMGPHIEIDSRIIGMFKDMGWKGANNLNDSLDTQNTLKWQTNPETGWFDQVSVSYDGEDAAQSRTSTSSSSPSSVSTTVDCAGTVSFWWNKTCYDNGSLEFQVDGTTVARWTEPASEELPSGSTAVWLTDWDAAVDLAKIRKRPLLAVFGDANNEYLSQYSSRVLDSAEFLSYAAENQLVLYRSPSNDASAFYRAVSSEAGVSCGLTGDAPAIMLFQVKDGAVMEQAVAGSSSLGGGVDIQVCVTSDGGVPCGFNAVPGGAFLGQSFTLENLYEPGTLIDSVSACFPNQGWETVTPSPAELVPHDQWHHVSYEVKGDSEHTLAWNFSQRAGERVGCAWLDRVTWTPVLALQEKNISISSQGCNNRGFSVTTAHAWTAVSNVSWLTVSAASGTGNGIVSFSAPENMGSQTRTGKITVSANGSSMTLTVSQPSMLSSFSYENYGSGISITYYSGSESEVVIPREIKGRPVLHIASGAFRHSDMQRLVIPETVTVIAQSVFEGYDLLGWFFEIYSECDSIVEMVFMGAPPQLEGTLHHDAYQPMKVYAYPGTGWDEMTSFGGFAVHILAEKTVPELMIQGPDSIRYGETATLQLYCDSIATSNGTATWILAGRTGSLGNPGQLENINETSSAETVVVSAQVTRDNLTGIATKYITLLPAPPSPPSDISHVSSASEGIRLRWKASPGAVYYQVLRKGDDGYVPIGGWTRDTEFLDGNTEYSKMYYYCIRASRNEDGSDPSELSQAHAAYRHVPVPTFVSASKGMYDSYIRLAWEYVKGCDYCVLHRKGNDGSVKNRYLYLEGADDTEEGDTLWFVDEQVQHGVTYTYQFLFTLNSDYDNLTTSDALVDFGYLATDETAEIPDVETHSADTNQDWSIDHDELLRVVALYQARGYKTEAGTVDGYSPGNGYRLAAHDADTDDSWTIDLPELVRVVQLHNSVDDSGESGKYAIADGTVDGFSPVSGEAVGASLPQLSFAESDGTFLPGKPCRVTCTLDLSGCADLKSLGLRCTLPEGVTVRSVPGTSSPSAGSPSAGDGGMVEFFWIRMPETETVSVVLELDVPETQRQELPLEWRVFADGQEASASQSLDEYTYKVTIVDGEVVGGVDHFIFGSAVTVKAIVPEGLALDSWQTDVEDLVVPVEPNSSESTFVMPACDVTLKPVFREHETVTVVLQPEEIREVATWTLSDGEPHRSGETCLALLGESALTFSSHPGWTSPEPRNLVIEKHDKSVITVSYVKQVPETGVTFALNVDVDSSAKTLTCHASSEGSSGYDVSEDLKTTDSQAFLLSADGVMLHWDGRKLDEQGRAIWTLCADVQATMRLRADLSDYEGRYVLQVFENAEELARGECVDIALEGVGKRELQIAILETTESTVSLYRGWNLIAVEGIGSRSTLDAIGALNPFGYDGAARTYIRPDLAQASGCFWVYARETGDMSIQVAQELPPAPRQDRRTGRWSLTSLRSQEELDSVGASIVWGWEKGRFVLVAPEELRLHVPYWIFWQ